MIIARKESAEYLTGGYWTERPQTWSDAMRNDVTEIRFEIACGSRKPVEGAAFHILEPYGRTGSAIKVFPVTADFF